MKHYGLFTHVSLNVKIYEEFYTKHRMLRGANKKLNLSIIHKKLLILYGISNVRELIVQSCINSNIKLHLYLFPWVLFNYFHFVTVL